MSYVDQIYDLLDEASLLPYGPAHTALCREAVKLADANSDPHLGYEARFDLIEAAIFGGAAEEAIVAFSWCVAKSAEDPDNFPEDERGFDLLWTYKWIALSVSDFPQISLEQIRETLELMKERYTHNRLSLRPYHSQWVSVGIQLGEDPTVIAKHFDAYTQLERDAYADCLACERNGEVEYHLFRGDYAHALKVAEPLLTNKLSCAEVPHGTYALLLLAAWDAGDVGSAEQFARSGYTMCKSNPDFLIDIGTYVEYAGLSGNFDHGVQIFERHLPWWRDSNVTAYQLRFEIGSAVLFRALSTVRDEIGLKIPSDVAWQTADGRYLTSELADRFYTFANDHAVAFDKRNGNTKVSDGLAHALARLAAS